MKNFNNNINKTILIILGTFIIIFYCYFRLIYKRVNDTLYFVNYSNETLIINIYLGVFIIFLFIISTCMIIYLICILIFKPIKIPSNIFIKYINYVTLIIKESLLAVNDFIGEYVPDSYTKLKSIILWFYKVFGKKEYFIIIIFVMLPYIILGISLVIDTFIFFKLYYFYKMLPLIILPLLFFILNFLISELLKNLEYIEEDLIITHYFLPDGRDHFNFKIKPHVSQENVQDIMTISITEYLALYPLKGFQESFSNKESKLKKYSLLFMYSCYFICCFYIIVLNFKYFISVEDIGKNITMLFIPLFITKNTINTFNIKLLMKKIIIFNIFLSFFVFFMIDAVYCENFNHNTSALQQLRDTFSSEELENLNNQLDQNFSKNSVINNILLSSLELFILLNITIITLKWSGSQLFHFIRNFVSTDAEIIMEVPRQTMYKCIYAIIQTNPAYHTLIYNIGEREDTRTMIITPFLFFTNRSLKYFLINLVFVILIFITIIDFNDLPNNSLLLNTIWITKNSVKQINRKMFIISIFLIISTSIVAIMIPWISFFITLVSAIIFLLATLNPYLPKINSLVMNLIVLIHNSRIINYFYVIYHFFFAKNDIEFRILIIILNTLIFMYALTARYYFLHKELNIPILLMLVIGLSALYCRIIINIYILITNLVLTNTELKQLLENQEIKESQNNLKKTLVDLSRNITNNSYYNEIPFQKWLFTRKIGLIISILTCGAACITAFYARELAEQAKIRLEEAKLQLEQTKMQLEQAKLQAEKSSESYNQQQFSNDLKALELALITKEHFCELQPNYCAKNNILKLVETIEKSKKEDMPGITITKNNENG